MKKFTVLFVLFACIRSNAQVLIKYVHPGIQSGVMSSQNIVFDNKLYYHGVDTDFSPGSIFVSDGTDAGTRKLLGAENITNFGHLTNTGTKLFFDGFLGVRTLFVSNGKDLGTKGVRGFETTPIEAIMKIDTNKVLLFVQADPLKPNPNQLWVSDATVNGTLKIADINATTKNTYKSSNFKGGAVFFDNSTNTTKMAPMISDGTSAGTLTIQSYLSKNGLFNFDNVYTAYGVDSLLFVGGIKNSVKLTIVTDGTSAGTKEISLSKESSNYLDVFFINTSFIIHNDKDISSYDYTRNEAVFLTTDAAPYGAFKVHKDRLYFYAAESNGDTYICVTDGTKKGTLKVDNSAFGVTTDANIQVLGNRIYFVIETIPLLKEIWRFHQDTLKAESYTDFGGRFRPVIFNTIPNQIILSRYTNVLGSELYKVDNNSTASRDFQIPDKISAFPVPANREIFIDLSKLNWIPDYLEVYNLSGQLYKKVKYGSPSVQPIKLDVQELPQGNYLLKLFDKQKVSTLSFTKK
ncbi:MAG: T9SS type A sorting domain-containing protein [Saprospiraceae bacterium]|nr:T9SS type A sorting domain-containing protein [Candidatus Vicinibacter affinis]